MIFKDSLEDLSIKQAKPKILALDFLINLTHSKLDLPVVITSSTINTREFFLIEKPLLNLNFPSTRSQNIVSLFNNLPISYPIIIPPIAGDKIISIFFMCFLIFLLNDKVNLFEAFGKLSNFAH